MKCPHCNNEIDTGEWIKIPELGIEVQKEVHDQDKSWDDLGLGSREKELLTADQCMWLANSKYAKELKMDGSSSKDDFFIQQPFQLNKRNGHVAGFYAGLGVTGLSCDGNPSYSGSSLGVRFARKIKKKVKK